MSIYATLWILKFPRHGDDHTECGWVEVIAQGVPAHIGAPDVYGNDPYADFLPPAVATSTDEDAKPLRAVVFVMAGTPKGTARSPQKYVSPLLTLSGNEYATATFEQLHEWICDALRGDRPRLLAEFWGAGGGGHLLFGDGRVQDIERDGG